MEDDIGDRISQLPEPLLHIILSKLPQSKDVVRTSVLSKTWGSLWVSLPYLNFEEQVSYLSPGIFAGPDVERLRDQDKARTILRKREEFITYVDDTVSRRRDTNIRTQKFRLRISFPRSGNSSTSSSSISLASRIDQWIAYAVDAKVEDLDLSTHSSDDIKYKLPDALFASKTLSILSLNFCRIEPNGEIRLPSLHKIDLVHVYIEEPTFQQLLSSSTKIERVDTSSCFGLENNYSFSNLKLKHVKVGMFRPGMLRPGISRPSEVGKVLAKSPYLQCLKVYAQNVPCEITITSCYNLKEVVLSGSELVGVTERYIQDLISKLPYLENLTLSLFSVMKSIDISSPRLKVLKITRCYSLVEVKIDAPNLLYFEFRGHIKTSIWLMSTSSHLEVNLFLKAEDVEDVKDLRNDWFADLIEFLNNFDRCKVLTLKVLSDMSVFIPKELREELLPSLYNVKQLKLIILREPTREFVSLVDGLLWIFPRVEALTIISKSDHKHIEFVYGEQRDSYEEPYCCRSHPRRCWRHFLRQVKIVNFCDSEVQKILREYFIQNVEMVQILD